MIGPVFSFDHISRSKDGNRFSGCCLVTADMPFFNGHFPQSPIMPAAAQIEMIQSLLQRHSDWHAIIVGGRRLKFSGRIGPGDSLDIQVQRTTSGDIGFKVKNGTTVVSKGTLQLAGDSDG